MVRGAANAESVDTQDELQQVINDPQSFLIQLLAGAGVEVAKERVCAVCVAQGHAWHGHEVVYPLLGLPAFKHAVRGASTPNACVIDTKLMRDRRQDSCVIDTKTHV